MLAHLDHGNFLGGGGALSMEGVSLSAGVYGLQPRIKGGHLLGPGADCSPGVSLHGPGSIACVWCLFLFVFTLRVCVCECKCLWG